MKSKYTDAYYKKRIREMESEMKVMDLQNEWRKDLATIPNPIKKKVQKLDLIASQRVVSFEERTKILGSYTLANLWFDYFTEQRFYESFFDYQWRVRYVPFANLLSDRVTLEAVKRHRAENIRDLAFDQISYSTEYDRLHTTDYYSHYKSDEPASLFIEPEIIRSIRSLNSN